MSDPVKTIHSFRCEHVGSYLRPQHLLQARKDVLNGAITPAQLRAIEDSSIANLVDRQEQVGLQSVTDGEQVSSV